MKNGLFLENEQLIYYKNDRPYHAGIVKVDGDIYYISSKGRAVKGLHVVHGEMTNGIVKKGTYTFGEDYKMIPKSYIPPRKRRKKLSSLLKNTKKWMPATSGILGLVLLGLFVVNGDRILSTPDVGPEAEVEQTVVETVPQGSQDETVHLPAFDGKVLLCSEGAKELYDGKITVEQSVQRGSAYRPLKFEYDLMDRTGSLVISEAENAAVARVFILDPVYTSISIDNLKTDTGYDYIVTVDGEEYTGSFETEKSTRFLSIPGVSNVRDIGGYETMDGRTVKQGMIIRGSEIDGMVVPSYFLSADDVESVRETFGFVYDFDLRGASLFTGNYGSRLGENVGHKFYGAPQYGEIFSRVYQPALREIFTDLADLNNYPMYLHCTHGADRTGTIVFLLQGLLNMSEEDMLREYRMTGFSASGYQTSAQMDIVVSGLKNYAGETIQEQIVSFLRDAAGITDEQIASIRNILLQ